MLNKDYSRRLILTFAAGVVLFIVPSAAAQKRDAFHIDYTVSISSVEGHLFHVIADVKNINEPRIELSLPTWTPGWYTVENYLKTFSGLRSPMPRANGCNRK